VEFAAAISRIYDGRTELEKGTVVGHEIMGVIDQVGEAVDGIQEGDPWFCFLTLPAAAASTAIADTRRLVSP
jgi:threonine dehydrogenase-like Zn-dependent dehydrogenase